jgi:cadmium resistance protein CadD (predicted permease)
MGSDGALVSLAIGLFVATNLDDIFVLLGFLSDPRYRPRQVAVGQFLGIATLYAASVVASLLALVVSPAYVGFLGILPIFIGLRQIRELRQSGTPEDAEDPPARSGRWNALSIAAVTIANGGDNLSVYIPIFATRSRAELAVIGAVFAAMTLLWLAAAFWLTRHRTLGAPIRRHGRRVVPFVLVGLGCYILYAAGSFTLLIESLSHE